MKLKSLFIFAAALAGIFAAADSSRAQGTAFTYQGRLNAGGSPANGSYDLKFTVIDAVSNGNTVGGPVTNLATALTNGLFTITLDFGAGVFSGPPRWLEIGVKSNGNAGGFITLTPRQALTATPYAVTADHLSGTITASQLSGTLASGQLEGGYTGALSFTNAANSFVGDASGLSNFQAGNLNGTIGIANGGTGQNTSSAALAALGGASVTANNTFTGTNVFAGAVRLAGYVLGGIGNGTTIYTDPTGNQAKDASLIISSSPWTSGSFFTTEMKMTNQIGSPDLYGYYTWDDQALSIGSVGWQALEGDLPGVNLIVMNQEPLAIATSSGTGNLAQIWVSHWPDGYNVIFPLTGDGTKHRPIQTTYYGAKVFPADGQGSTLWINEDTGTVSMLDGPGGGLVLGNGVKLTTTNGVVLKANGTLNNNAAFDPADTATVYLNSATVEATNFVAPASYTGGPGFAGRVAFDAAGNGSGMTFELTPNGGSVPGLVFGTGGNPCFAMTGTNNSWFNQPCAAVGGAELEDGRTWGNSMLDVHGGTALAINTYTANHTATVQDSTILANGMAVTITLPDATFHCRGRTYTIKLIANSVATVATTASQKIDEGTTYPLSAQDKYVTVQSDGTQWRIIGNN